MKQLTRLAVERPITILMLILALVILGAQGYRSLKIDRYPSIVIPFVSVNVSWPGAAPEDVEQQITKIVENAVAGISGVDTIQSTSSQGSSQTSISFLQGVDSNQASVDVERVIGRIKNQLPNDASDPVVFKADPTSSPIMNLTLSGPQTQEDLYYSASTDIQPRLLAVPGVAAVNVNGGRQEEIQVQVDPMKMAAYGVSMAKVQSVLTTQNVDVPGGSLTAGGTNLAFRTLGRFGSLEDIQNVIVSSSPQIVRLKDLANVVDTYYDVTQILRLNGQPTVGLNVTKQPDANVIQVSDGIKAMMARLQPIVPKGAKLTVVTDDAEFTRASVNSVQTDLILAVLITGIVLLLFLHMVRSTIIVLLAVPTSLIPLS